MNRSSNKTFCVIPWINLSTHTNGDVRLCCVSDEFIKDSADKPFNLGINRVSDIVNSDSYKSIRKKMLHGQSINGCYKCYEIEKDGGKSYRQNFNEIWNDNKNLQEKIKQSLEDEDIDATVQYFDLRFGNLCNLSCRSCYPGASSQFDKEIKQLSHTPMMKYHRPNDVYLNDWYATDTFQTNLEMQLPFIREYYATGGEPTIIEQNYSILKKMIDTGHSKHIVLRFNTNLTNTKFDFYSMLGFFEKVQLVASIDGKDQMQEYLRFPSKWQQISSNLTKIIEQNKDNLSITVSPVIQKINLAYITDLFEYIESFNRQKNKLIVKISPIILIDPPYLDFKFLPIDYKLRCWEKISDWLSSECQYQNSAFHRHMIAVKKRCIEEVDFLHNLESFFEFTKILDNHRDQSLRSVNPELADFPDKYEIGVNSNV